MPKVQPPNPYSYSNFDDFNLNYGFLCIRTYVRICNI